MRENENDILSLLFVGHSARTICDNLLTLKVLVTTIDALGHFETG